MRCNTATTRTVIFSNRVLLAGIKYQDTKIPFFSSLLSPFKTPQWKPGVLALFLTTAFMKKKKKNHSSFLSKIKNVFPHQRKQSCSKCPYHVLKMHVISITPCKKYPQSHDYSFSYGGKLMEGAHITAQRMIRTTPWISSEASQLPRAACVWHCPSDSLALAEQSGWAAREGSTTAAQFSPPRGCLADFPPPGENDSSHMGGNTSKTS